MAVEMLGPSIGEWLARTRKDSDNYLAALEWSLHEEEGDAALAMATSLAPYWYRTSSLGIGRRFLEPALGAADSESPWFVRGKVALAWLAYASGDEDASVLANEAASLGDEGSDASNRLGAQQVLAGTSIDSGDPRSGLAAAMEALDLARELGAEEAIGISEQMAGLALHALGRLDEAAAYLEAARDRMRAYRTDVDAGWILVQLGDVQLGRGDCEAAIASSSAAIDDFRARDDPRGIASAQILLAKALADRDREQARRLLDQALAVADRWGYRPLSEQAGALLRELSSD